MRAGPADGRGGADTGRLCESRVKSKPHGTARSANSPRPLRWRTPRPWLADRAGNISQMLANRATNADALHAAGERGRPQDLFADAERRRHELQARNSPSVLPSCGAIQHCDLLLSRGRVAPRGTGRATQTLQWARTQHFPLDMALETLSLSRSSLVLTLESLAGRRSAQTECEDARAAACDIDEAVEGLAKNLRRKRPYPARPSSPAPPSAAPSASGRARRATSTKQKRSPSRRRCGSISAIARSSARGSHGAPRRLRAAQRLCRAEPAAAGLARSRRCGGAQGGGAEATRCRPQTQRGMRLPSPRRRTCRTRRRHRRRPPLRRPAASRLRRGKRTQLFA